MTPRSTACWPTCGALHRLPVTDVEAAPFANPAMQALNHAYIFALPMTFDPAVGDRLDDLTPGLGRVAATLVADQAYRDAVIGLGEHYLHAPPRALVHGDYFPGSWLSRDGAVVVIDPEFCFAGAPEFDYGVMAAHLLLADQDAALVARVARAASAEGHDLALAAGHAGVEDHAPPDRRGPTAALGAIAGAETGAAGALPAAGAGRRATGVMVHPGCSLTCRGRRRPLSRIPPATPPDRCR